MTTDKPAVRIGHAERAQTDEALAKAHALGQLSLDEFEERVSKVEDAKTRGELDALLADLPSNDKRSALAERMDRLGARAPKPWVWIPIGVAVFMLLNSLIWALASDHDGPMGGRSEYYGHEGFPGFPFFLFVIAVVFFVVRRRRHRSHR